MEKMKLREPKCDYCKYLMESDTKYICRAFPDEIPSEALFAEDDVECAPGIKFEEIEH